jgi:uncharacterized protein
MWQSIANIILRNKFTILGVITLLTVFFAYNIMSGIRMDNKYGILLPKKSEARLDYDRLKALFGEDGGTLIIALETDSLYTKERLLKWKQLGDSILHFDGVQSVVSEATLFTISNNQEERIFEAHRVFSDISFQEKSVDSIEREIKNQPLYKGLLYDEKERVSLMMIGIDDTYISDQKKSGVVLEIEKLASQFAPELGNMRYTGLPHLRVVIGKRVTEEMYIFVALLALVTSSLIFFFFRSLRVVFICILVVLTTVIWSMGTIALFDFELTLIMALIPPLMIVIGIPNCIFLFTKFHQEIKEHGNKILALSRVIKKIGTATLLTNFTTALGFLTFVTTNSDKLVQFGIVAAVNIMMIFILSLTLIPIIASISKSPQPKHLKHLERKFATGLINSLVRITLYHRPWVYVVTLAVVVVSIFGIVRIKATGNITSDLPEGHQILEDFEFIQDNFGGSIPFEILIDYKEPSRLAKSSTLEGVEQIGAKYSKDTLFSKHISYVDVLKAANMAYYNNDSTQFRLVTNKRKLAELKRYIDSSLVTNTRGVGVAMNELIDTAERVLRIRSQVRDVGTYEISDKVKIMRKEIDEILNPDKVLLEKYYKKYETKGKIDYIDSILYLSPEVANDLSESFIKNEDDRFDYDSDPMGYLSKFYSKTDFKEKLRASLDNEYFGITMTGTAIVASEGTQYMVYNLFSSLIFAIIAIAILMAILFRSWRMVLISMVPNVIPLIFTAGIMGWFGIALKPSTLLVFSIAFGISVDDTIHYLAKYRLELKSKRWDLKQCIIMALRESGLGMFYTSIILFSGFIVFTFSQFGGTQALGLLISLTLLVAMITNLVVLPTLLLTLERSITTKSFEEPFFDAYNEESNIDWEALDVQGELPQIDDNESSSKD